MGHKDLQLPKAGLYCEERHQCNRNMENNVPITNGLLLEGEWTVYLSGESSKSKGCSRGTDEHASVDEAAAECCQQLGTADVDPGRGAKSAEMPNEPEMLITVLIQSEGPDGSDTPRVYLGGLRMWMGNANGPVSQVDVSNGLTDGLGAQTDTPITSNGAETTGMSSGEGAGTYLSIGDTKHAVLETDGNGYCTDTSTVHMDAHSARNETRTPADIRRNVKTRQVEAQPQYSPVSPGIGVANPTYRWKRVSVGNGNGNVRWNAPVEALGQTLVFGDVESGDKAIAPSIEGETARDGDGDGDGDNGDVDGATSSGDVDLN